MIRPITVATFLLACGSGLYLYQEKHEVQMLDRTIEKTVHDTAGLRDQSRVLAAEWTMLNDPERLRQYSDKYLSLKPILPPQFTNLAGLDSRLPAVTPETPPQADQPAGDQAIASADGSAEPDGDTDAAPIASADIPPRPPLPPAAPPAAQVAAGTPAHPAVVQRASAPAPAEPGVD